MESYRSSNSTLPLEKEQFIYELSQLNEDTGATSEARMDIVAEMPQLRAMLDVRVFFQRLPVSGSRRERMKWKSTIGTCMLRIKVAGVAPT